MNPVALFSASFERGGVIMWPILAVSLVAWFVGLDKLFFIRKFSRARERFLKILKEERIPGSAETGCKTYDSLLGCLKRGGEGRFNFRHVFREFLIFSVDDLERDLSTMSAWISTAPLLGLLGTVAGMIRTFKIITEFGIGNPHLMAEGISIALLTTQAGLTVAFPAMLFHNMLINRKNRIIGLLIKDGEELSKRFE